MVKLNDRCFCYFTAAMFVSLRGAQTWRLHTKLYKFVWDTSPNNGRMKNCTHLNLGEVIYVSVIFHIPASWLNLLNGYDFYFWWRDTAKRSTDQTYNIMDWQPLFTWLWRWLPLRLSKRQSTTTVLFRITLTRTITLYELLILPGSNHLLCLASWRQNTPR